MKELEGLEFVVGCPRIVVVFGLDEQLIKHHVTALQIDESNALDVLHFDEIMVEHLDGLLPDVALFENVCEFEHLSVADGLLAVGVSSLIFLPAFSMEDAKCKVLDYGLDWVAKSELVSFVSLK